MWLFWPLGQISCVLLCCCCRLARDGGASVCVCDSSLGSSADPATLTLSRDSSSILVKQSGTVYSDSAFEELVQSIYFTYDSTRLTNLESYYAVIMVTVSDGELLSPPAFTTVQVNVTNEAPRVLLDGQVYRNMNKSLNHNSLSCEQL